MNEVHVLSTRDLAQAIGVSESSIKRWADEGVIRVARTAGGHRRIPLSEAVRFIRDAHVAVVRPDLLGLHELDAVEGRIGDPASEAEQLGAYLLAGAAPEARGLILSFYLRGHSVAAIADGPVRSAMTGIGELWRHDPGGVFLEHRATDICIQALNQLRSTFAHRPDAPHAVGGCPEGDPYLLPSLIAATALAAEGFRAVNLGPDTPFASLRTGVIELKPALVWISVSSPTAPERMTAAIGEFARAVRPAGASVVVGGRGLTDPPPLMPNLHVGSSMAELVAFARGLAVAAAR